MVVLGVIGFRRHDHHEQGGPGGRAQIDEISAWLGSRFHRYRLFEASHGEVPLDILLSVGRFDPAQADLAVHAHDHSKMFSTWCYESDRPLSVEALREVVSKLPPEIYRAKGVVYTSDAPERRAVLQVVGKRGGAAQSDRDGSEVVVARVFACAETESGSS